MDFTFNEEQTLIQDQVDQFIQKEYDWETRQSLSNSELGYGDDNWKKDLKLVEKIEKKLVHLYYLDRGNK